MDFRGMIIIAIVTWAMGAAAGSISMHNSIKSDCDTLTAVRLSGQAYTCFKELTEEDDK